MKNTIKHLVAFLAISSATAGELALIIDTSGSMSGTKIEQAKTAASAMIDLLDSGTYLSIRKYNDCDTERIFDMAPMTPANRTDAKAMVAGLYATGLTPIAKSLQDAEGDFLKQSTPRVILLLTDGVESCDYSADLSGIAKIILNNGLIKTFIVGYDLSASAAATFQDVAKSGDGEYLDASSTSNNDLNKKLIKAVNQSGVINDKKPLALRVSGPGALAKNRAGTYKAHLIYNDGSIEDVTKKALWDALPVDFAKERGNKVKLLPVRFWMTATYSQMFGGYRVNVK
jgi:hypothetical protein